MEQSLNNKIKYPYVRLNIESALRFLAHSENCLRVEVFDEKGELKKYHDFDMAAHILLDDNEEILEKPQNLVGIAFVDVEEARLAQNATKALDLVLKTDKTGPYDDVDAEYVKTPRWKSVIESARLAYERMIAADQNQEATPGFSHPHLNGQQEDN